MPKVDYNKNPFRLCRWNIKIGKTNDFWCNYSLETVNKDICMKCFCNKK
ncbi:MAG: hypothetical protein KGD57_10015 [Candidatus Lokiarchaeota archaeon]|nr:hypothetical protein [Candidatus Lokiarchaeota archaeon]